MGGDWKAFFKGIQENDLELVRYYLKMGVNPSYQHPEYMTAPLMEAIRFNHLEIAKLLLENDANANAKEHFTNITAMDIAKKKGNERAVDLLKNYVS